MRAAAIAIVCSGCAQLAGIKDTTAPSGVETLRLQRVSIGATVVTEPLDLAAPPIVLLPSSTVTATQTMPGEWTARASGAVGVLYTGNDLPTPYQHLLALGPTQSANEIVFDHPNSAAPPAGATLNVNVTLPGTYAATQTLQIVAVGAWANHTLGVGEVPALGASAIMTTVPYASFQTMTIDHPVVAISLSDQVLVLRYSGPTLTGQLLVPPFAQTGNDPITGTMAAVTPTTPFDATVDPMAVASRLDAAKPAGTSFSSSWRLDASPGYTVGVSGGIELTGGSLVMTDKTFASSYANPFASLAWKPIVTYSCSSSRTYMMGMTPVTLVSSMTAQTDPASGLVLDLPVALPQTIALAGMPLITDGMTATLDPSQPADVALTTDGMPADLYGVKLVDFIADTNGVVTATPVLAMFALGPDVTIPPNVLQPGHTYVLQAEAVVGGYTNAAAGDLQTFALPASYGIATSGVFTVASP